MQVKDLRPNAKNPRKISKAKLKALEKSLAKFGDLSGFVFNRRTRSLISGHQRTKTIPNNATIKIEHSYEAPTKALTVAEGYVLIDGERFRYREVDAPRDWEMEALLAANKHGGEWDADLLRIAIADVGDISVTGFDIPELKAFNIEMSQSDEEYVRNTPETTEPIDQERIPPKDGETSFEKVEEKTEVSGKRYVVIVECPNQEMKDRMREIILPHVTEAGCKIF